MDGDTCQSTVDVLYSLYDKVETSGLIVTDDWNGFPAKDACMDFFRAHKVSPSTISTDRVAVYWQKTEHISIQYWRYEKQKLSQ